MNGADSIGFFPVLEGGEATLCKGGSIGWINRAMLPPAQCAVKVNMK